MLPKVTRPTAEQTMSEQENVIGSKGNPASPIILVVEDVHETREGIEKLLAADGCLLHNVSMAA